MKATTLTIKIDKKTKDQSQRLADQLGFSLSAIIKAQLRHFIRTKKVDVSLREERPTKYFDQLLKEAEEDIKAGRVTSFKDSDEMLKYLDREIEHAKKKQPANSL